jgi:hypothetical protein
MTDDKRRKRKVIEGSQVFFEEDVTIREDALKAPLPLPPLDLPLFGELVILFRDQFFHLVEQGNEPDRMTLCGLSFPIVPSTTVQAVEERCRQTPTAAAVQVEFLRGLHPSFVDAAGAPVRTKSTQLAASLALDKLKLIAAAESTSLRKPLVPIDHIRPPAQVSVLGVAVPGYERLLFLDGRVHDLLTSQEFFASWKRGFHPDIVQQVLERATPWPARELADFLHKNAARANARALSVVCAGLHTRHRPVSIVLDGLDFVPVLQGPTLSFLEDWQRVLAQDLKRRALGQFLDGEGA